MKEMSNVTQRPLGLEKVPVTIWEAARKMAAPISSQTEQVWVRQEEVAEDGEVAG